MLPIILGKNKTAIKNTFSYQSQRFLIISTNDLRDKIKYNQHLLKLVKQIKKYNNTLGEKNKRVENVDLHLCFSYLYQNVAIQTVTKKKNEFTNIVYNNDIVFAHKNGFNENTFTEYASHSNRSVSNIKYEPVIINKNSTRLKNIQEIYSVVLNSVHLLSPKHILLFLYSLFLFHTWNYQYLKIISTQVLNNIYNYKTGEYILIQLMYVFFEKKENGTTPNLDAVINALITATAKRKTTPILCDYRLDTKDKKLNKRKNQLLFPLVKELTRYGNHLFYKRKEDLLLSDMKDLLFIYQSYDQSIENEQLLQFTKATLGKNLQQINAENVKSTLSNRTTEFSMAANNFITTLHCYYYLSSIKSAAADYHPFTMFYKYVSSHGLEKYLTVNQLFLMLQLCNCIHLDEKKKNLHCVLHLLDEKLKLKKMLKTKRKIEKPFWETDVEKVEEEQEGEPNEELEDEQEKIELQKYEETCVPLQKDATRTVEKKGLEKWMHICNCLYALYKYSECASKERKTSNFHTAKMDKQKTIEKSNTTYVQMKYANKLADENKSNQNGHSIPNYAQEHMERNKIKQVNKNDKECATDMSITSFSLAFFDDINIYIKRNHIHHTYFEILLSTFFKSEIRCEQILLHFLNELNLVQTINGLLLYIHLLSQYFKNIYILFYIEYFYAYIFKNKFNDFSANKTIVLLSSLYNCIYSKGFLKDNTKYNWEKNMQHFLLLLRQHNMPLYTHVTHKIHNLNFDNSTHFDQLLFHMFYKNMIKNTFSCLVQNLFYIHDESILKECLYYFLNIYYNCYKRYSDDINISQIKEIATFFFLRIFHVHFVHVYQMKDDHTKDSTWTKTILHYVHLEKEVHPILTECLMRVYFLNSCADWKGDEDICAFLTYVFQKLFQIDCHLKYENNFFVLQKKENANSLSLHDEQLLQENHFVQKDEYIYALHIFLLIQLKVSISSLFIRIKEFLYYYSK